jgi:LacI family transcriptional regulator
MGAIQALHEFGLHVPYDVSVLGYDDIDSAAYQICSLTTVRQSLRKMGRAAADIVLRQLAHPKGAPEIAPTQIRFEPKLGIRETTAVARRQPRCARVLPKPKR